MPKCYADIILSINPSADVEAVGDVADDYFRYFGEMTRDDWVFCIDEASK